MPVASCRSPYFGSSEKSQVRTYLRAKDKRGLKVPWVYARRVIASNWHIPPYLVDYAPIDEIELELQIQAIESEVNNG